MQRLKQDFTLKGDVSQISRRFQRVTCSQFTVHRVQNPERLGQRLAVAGRLERRA